MPITSNTERAQLVRSATAQASGNATMFELDPRLEYVAEVDFSSPGTATLRFTVADVSAPANFTDMPAAFDGTQTVNFARSIRGARWVGVDVASGAATIHVRRVAV